MDVYGNNDLGFAENLMREAEQELREMIICGSGDGAKDNDDLGLDEDLIQAERDLEWLRGLKRKREMRILKSLRPRPIGEDEDEDEDSDVDYSSPSCPSTDSDSESDGGWYDYYERDSGSNSSSSSSSSSSSNGPPQEIKDFAQLGIDEYNKREGTHYSVVDIISSEKYAVQGFVAFVKFTAKLPDQDDADAIKFKTEVWVDLFDKAKLEFVGREFTGPLTEEETSVRGRKALRLGYK